jgi:hypothetical protein
MLYKDQIDKNRIPAHIAIIMDGNGRWAKQQGHARTFGHQAGAETVHVIAEEAARLGVKYLTLYTFSTENWNRPVDEIAALMSLLMDSIEEETFMKNNISFRIIGETEKLPENVLSTSLQVLLCLIVSEEETCRLNYVLSTNLIPLQVLRITLSSNTDVVTVNDQLALLNVSLDSTVEMTVHCIILQHVSHVIYWAQVIDSYYLYFLCVLSLNCRTEYETTDTAKSVNTNLNHCS